jgi:signal transduction histidine kinase
MRLSWLSLAVFVVLVCVLGVLQYRWIGEISQTEQKKLQDNLQSRLNEISRDFNSQLSDACGAMLPAEADVEDLGRERAYERRYTQWKDSTNHPRLFSRIALVWPEDGELFLRMLNLDSGVLVPADWPPSWSVVKERLYARLRNGPGRPMRPIEDTVVIDVPRFRGFDGGRPPGFGRPGEQDWLLVEVDTRYIARDVLPDLLAQHLGGHYKADYQIEVFARSNPAALIFPPQAGAPSIENAEASVSLFDIAPFVPGGRGPGPGRGLAPPGDPGRGRWQLLVELRAGSLEAIVARARRRNLGISAAILLLLLATGGALVRFSRQAQRLAAIEMEFVAGVSHELRTPLTVIRTAAFNLRGKLSGNPAQVERYGVLIQQEAEKLTAIVEQVLRFARARTGRAIRGREPVSVERLIDESLQASKDILEEIPCAIEKGVEQGLPLILGDSTALRHALQNLIHNAAKYGMDGSNWIGVFARTVTGMDGTAVELRVEDHGPGIPAEERKHVFEPFFRGERALQHQIHGTGLGLNLVKKIVEAHGGTVDVESETGAGTSFVVRIPAAPTEHQDEFAHSLG